MAQLRDISGGQKSSTGTISCPSRICGGVAIVADGTNAGTVILKNDNTNGTVIFQITTSSPLTVFAPFECSGSIYYSVSGTGCTAQIYEWIDKKS